MYFVGRSIALRKSVKNKRGNNSTVEILSFYVSVDHVFNNKKGEQ